MSALNEAARLNAQAAQALLAPGGVDQQAAVAALSYTVAALSKLLEHLGATMAEEPSR